MASLALIVAGGIYLSAHLPEHVPLAPAVVLLAASAAAALNLFLLSRVRFRLGAVLPGREVVPARVRRDRRDDRVRVPPQPPQRRTAGGSDAVAGRVRGTRAHARRLHGRAVRRHRASCGHLSTRVPSRARGQQRQRVVPGEPRPLRPVPARARPRARREAEPSRQPRFFRPYNNLRFRPGPPLKEHLGVAIGSGAVGGYYFELSLDGLLVGAGLYHPASDQLERFRAAIADDRRARGFERGIATARAAASRWANPSSSARPAAIRTTTPDRPPHARDGLSRHPLEPWLHEPRATNASDRR